jgi:predicted heme/steroid binding protein
MGRTGGLAILWAAALAAAPARGAEVTRVLSTGDPDSPAFSLEVRFERLQKTARITREFGENQNGQPATGVIRDEVELSYRQATDRAVARIAGALWRDLELHLEVPYVVDDTPHWAFGSGAGSASGYPSSIANATYDASGATCAATPCPMFPVGTSLYAGGALDDLTVGLTWGISNERRDPWVPTWVLSLDVTVPSAARYDPAAGRLDPTTYPGSFFDGPNFRSGKKAAVGHKIWVYDVSSAVSKRLGKVEPYLRAGVRIPQKTSSTYSNCEHAAEMAALPVAQMSSVAAANCASDYWKSRAEAQPPLQTGMVLGAEVVPLDEPARRFAVDFRVGSDFTGRGRWYDELTPATGKLLANEAYFTFNARVAAVYRSGAWRLGLHYAFQHDFPHFITGEPMGHVSNEIVAPNSPQQNPNFDFRWDLPGRRFRVTDTMVHGVGLDLTWAY